jgi:hypothetical protein
MDADLLPGENSVWVTLTGMGPQFINLEWHPYLNLHRLRKNSDPLRLTPLKWRLAKPKNSLVDFSKRRDAA